MTDTYNIFCDPGHSWVSVRPADLVAIGMTLEDISNHSYAWIAKDKTITIYLEEDCDASLFVNRYISTYGRQPEFREHYSPEPSKIRQYMTIRQLDRTLNENTWSKRFDNALADSGRGIV